MRIVLFCHSLLSDWNHGNAHFLRGIVTELSRRGHEVSVYEPRDSWSLQNLLQEHGVKPIRKFHAAYPGLKSQAYDLASIDLEKELRTADMVLVHEWNAPELVRRVGEIRAGRSDLIALFHDTHHRLVSDPDGASVYQLEQYDGVLAFGEVLRDLYLKQGRVKRAWTWHEAADTHVFRPVPDQKREGDLVWVGNWGDEERTAELHEFLIEPVRRLGWKARVYGVRYPAAAKRALAEAGIEYAGWLPNYEVPKVFARFQVTVHIPRRPYVRMLPGIPTIRVFEALACGMPLVCSPWEDTEKLFTPGEDYLVARDGEEMKTQLQRLMGNAELRRQLSQHARTTIQNKHTCARRVDELMEVVAELRG